jgi:E3 ubiquitin-protein ligase MARCH6
VDAVIYCLKLLGITLLAWSNVIWKRALHFVGFLLGKDLQAWSSSFRLQFDFHRTLSLFTAGDHGLFISQVGEATTWKLVGMDLLSYIPFDMQGADSPVSSFVTSMSETRAFRLAEERLAVLGRHIRVAFAAALNEWVELAEGDGTMERLWAIFLGYAIAALFAALYLNTITVGNVKSAGRAVRNAIRQQMIVLKVIWQLRRGHG